MTRHIKTTAIIAALLAALGILGQTSAEAQPPSQDYVLRFGGRTLARASLTPALNLGNEFTMEAWMYLEADSPLGIVLGRTRAPDDAGPFVSYALELMGSGRRLAFVQSTAQPSVEQRATASTDLPLFTWIHVAATLSGGTMRLYTNGEEVARATSPGPPENTRVPFAIGAATTVVFACCGGLQTTNGIFGALRQARLWNRALTPTELKANAGRYLMGGEAGLVAYWPLDDGAGQTVRDLGPNRVNLYLGTSPDTTYFDPRWVRTAVIDTGPYFTIEKVPNLAPGWGSELTLIDLGPNGNADIIVATNQYPVTPGRVYALRNDGRGHFTNATATVFGSQNIQTFIPVDSAAADFNGDGRTDVLIADTGPDLPPGSPPGSQLLGGQSRLLMQAADGTLVDETAAGLPALKAFTHRVCVADVNGDGAIDIYMNNLPSAENKNAALYMNDGMGHFKPDSARLPPINATTGLLTFGGGLSCRFVDVNKDGAVDLVLDDYGRARDVILLNDGSGHFRTAPDNALPPRFGGPSWSTIAIAAADFDGDGWPDLVMSTLNNIDMQLQLFLNNRDGTFRDASDRIPQRWPKGQGALVPFITIADFNGDGKPDFLTQGFNVELHLFLNAGDARFVDATEVLPVFESGHLLVGDLDNDGDVDIFSESEYFNYVLVRNVKPFPVSAVPSRPRRRP